MCIILSHRRQNFKLFCPIVVALDLWLQVKSITFRFYNLVIHQCRGDWSKTGRFSFSPYISPTNSLISLKIFFYVFFIVMYPPYFFYNFIINYFPIKDL
jgi:hypothetical protein